MKMAKFLVSHFDAGAEKFTAGQAYPLSDETRLCVARGAAEEVDIADEPAAPEVAATEEAAAPAAEAPAAPPPQTGKAKK